MNAKKFIQRVIDDLPLGMRSKAEKAVEKYRVEKREALSPEVVERLLNQLIQEAKDRGK